MARRRFLFDPTPTIDLDLTVEDLMHDLDPDWSRWDPSGAAAAADIAELLAVLR